MSQCNRIQNCRIMAALRKTKSARDIEKQDLVKPMQSLVFFNYHQSVWVESPVLDNYAVYTANKMVGIQERRVENCYELIYNLEDKK